jgi:hypothetical protein
MKRFFLLLVLLLGFASLAYASLLLETIDFALDVSSSAEEAKKKGTSVEQLKFDLSALDVPSMNESQRVAVYKENEMKSGGAFALNLFLGFGSGSKKQGDTTGTVVGIIGDSIGIGALGASLGLFMIDLFFIQPTIAIANGLSNRPTNSLQDTPLLKAALYTAIGGGAVLGVTRIFESIRVFTYASRYNRTLRDGLGLDKHLQLAAIPVIGSCPGDTGMMIVARIPL